MIEDSVALGVLVGDDGFGHGDRSSSSVIRRHWPNTRLTIRGDGDYPRPEVVTWCEANGVDDTLGRPGNAVLDRPAEPQADAVRARRAEAQQPVLRRYPETRYGAKPRSLLTAPQERQRGE